MSSLDEVECIGTENSVYFLLYDLKLLPIEHFLEDLGNEIDHGLKEVLVPIHDIIGAHLQDY